MVFEHYRRHGRAKFNEITVRHTCMVTESYSIMALSCKEGMFKFIEIKLKQIGFKLARLTIKHHFKGRTETMMVKKRITKSSVL